MTGGVSGGTFVTWKGVDGEKILFIRLPVPIGEYDAEPWGGILLVATQPGSGNIEILETENLRAELPKLAARLGKSEVFWKPERKPQDREDIRKKLGKTPRYIG